MRVSGCLTSKVAHQQSILQHHIFRDRQPYCVPVARRYRHSLAFAVFHMFESKVDVALRGHQLKAIADGKFIFHRHRRQLAVALAGKFADELLAFGNRVAVLIVLVVIVRMATQKTLGIAAMREVFQGIQQGSIERFACGGVVNGLAVDLSGTGTIVM